MADASFPKFHMDEPGAYRIRVRGYLNALWVESLWATKSVTVYAQQSRDESVIIGEVMDQAQLLGIVNALHDRGYSVIELEQIASKEPPDADC